MEQHIPKFQGLGTGLFGGSILAITMNQFKTILFMWVKKHLEHSNYSISDCHVKEKDDN